MKAQAVAEKGLVFFKKKNGFFINF